MDSIDALRNGINKGTLDSIYEKLYEYPIGGKDPSVTIQPLTEVNGLTRREGIYELIVGSGKPIQRSSIQRKKSFWQRVTNHVFQSGL